MSKLLLEKGYDPILIDYADTSKPWNNKLRKKVLRDRVFCLIRHPMLVKTFIASKNNGKYAVNAREEALRNKFDSFIQKEFTTVQNDYTHDNSIEKFIAGSDQIWQLSVPGLHPTFFLRFCNQEKRIAYSASFGTTTIYKYNKKKLKKYLSEIPHISVREDVALEVIHKVLPDRKDVVQALDPVLMHDAKWWRQEETTSSETSARYILCYFLNNPSDYRLYIDSVVTKFKEKVEVIWISTGYENTNEGEIVVEPSPREFISLIDNAEHVITDSLHGMEFSILFHKSFTACERRYLTESEQSSRVLSLLGMLNLKDRLINDSVAYPLSEIDYDPIDQIIEKHKNESFEYLFNALDSTGKNSKF